MINIQLENDACSLLAKISRGTPRIAVRLLKRVRDYAQVIKNTNKISLEIIENARPTMFRFFSDFSRKINP